MLLFSAMLDDPMETTEFTRLYEYYHGLAFWVAKRILQDDYLAEDAMQEAFIRIAKNFSRISEKSPVESTRTKNLIVIIVERAAIDIYRKRKKYLENEIPTSAVEEMAYAAEATEDEEKNRLYRAIDALPQKYREVLILRYVNGLDNREIAGLLNARESTIRTLLFRGRVRLEYLLDKRKEKKYKRKGMD